MAKPKKTAPRVDAQRAAQALLSVGASPIRGLTPARLASHLEAFDLGYLRGAALLWQKIKDRCDTTKAVSAKRELDAALLNWEISTVDDSPEAARHKEALEAAYNSLSATDALDRNKRGGVATLIQQMMHAQGHKYAVHEIVWDPSRADLTAEFRFTPLQFFENTTGKLRFLPSEGAAFGDDLEEGGWMVTVGAGLMEATSIAYLFKSLPLKAWLVFCDKVGIPGLHGKTDAAYGSEDWNKFREALANFGDDWALVTSRNAEIETIDLKTGGQLPQPLLVDRMDRAIARLWRGNDLGTMSKDGSAVGANPQESETDILNAADALLISETLQEQFDRWVIRYRFGTEPLAYFQLQPKTKVNQELQLKIDDALIKWGCPRSKRELLSRYGRPEPDDGEELAGAQPAPAPATDAAPPEEPPAMAMANERAANGREALFRAEAMNRLAPARRAMLAPFVERLDAIDKITEPDAQRRALEAFKTEMPMLYRQAIARVPEAAAVLQEILGTALVSGVTEAAKPAKTT